MFRKKFRSVRLPAEDVEFLEEMAKAQKISVTEVLSKVIRIMREEAEEIDKENEAKRRNIEENIKELIPYLGEPDSMVDGEPGWTGAKYKRALKQYLLENDPETYEEYKDELDQF